MSNRSVQERWCLKIKALLREPINSSRVVKLRPNLIPNARGYRSWSKRSTSALLKPLSASTDSPTSSTSTSQTTFHRYLTWRWCWRIYRQASTGECSTSSSLTLTLYEWKKQSWRDVSRWFRLRWAHLCLMPAIRNLVTRTTSLKRVSIAQLVWIYCP